MKRENKKDNNQNILRKVHIKKISRRDFSNDIAETISDEQIHRINTFIERQEDPKATKETIDSILSFNAKQLIDNLMDIDQLYDDPEQNKISQKINEDLQLSPDRDMVSIVKQKIEDNIQILSTSLLK